MNRNFSFHPDEVEFNYSGWDLDSKGRIIIESRKDVLDLMDQCKDGYIPRLTIYSKIAKKLFANTKVRLFVELDTTRVVDMTEMFSGCQYLEYGPEMFTNNVTNMESMFSYCVSLTGIPTYNTSKVDNMSYMFKNALSLMEIPLLDTSNVTNMDFMFYGCDTLYKVPILNVEKVQSAKGIFNRCHALRSKGYPINNDDKMLETLKSVGIGGRYNLN